MPVDDETTRQYVAARLGQVHADLQRAQRDLLAAETTKQNALKQVVRIANELLPREYDQATNATPPLKPNDLDAMATWIIVTVKTMTDHLRRENDALGAAIQEHEPGRLAVANDRLTRQVATLREELAKARAGAAELTKLREESAQARQDVATRDAQLGVLRDDVIRLQQQLMDQRAQAPAVAVAPAPIPATQDLPAWAVEWQQTATYEPTRVIVEIMGKTGYCLREHIAKSAFPTVDDPRSGSVSRAFAAAIERGLIQELETKGEISGSTPRIYALTEQGVKAFQCLFSCDPVESEYNLLLARHKSLEHVSLNIVARGILRKYGYSVDHNPSPVTLPGGGKLDVDIVARKGDQVLYVECERGTQNQENLYKKFDLLRAVTQDLYFVSVQRGDRYADSRR